VPEYPGGFRWFGGTVVRAYTLSHERGHMKRFAFFAGFLLLTTALAIPFFLKRMVRSAQTPAGDNVRYDIDDYMATEGL
jgi:hypothetical protein